MNREQPLQDQLRELRSAGDRLLDTSPPIDRFFRELLAAVIDGQRLLAGIVWLVDQEGRLKPYCDSGLQNLSPDGRLTVGPREQQQLNAALRDGKVTILNGEAESQSGPRARVIGPLLADGRSVGGVELFYSPDQWPGAHRDLLHFVEEWCGYGVRYLDRQRLASLQPADPTGFWEQFEKFILELQRTLNTREVAAVAVNDGRLMIGCDRLSLVVQEGKRIKVRGISGQDDVEHRANLVNSMRHVARQVMRVGEPLIYRGEIQGIPPQLEKPLATFLQEGRARMALFLPLLPPEPFPHKEDKDPGTVKKRSRSKPIGCLVVEQFSESRPLPVLRQRADLVADHVAAALHNAQTHQTIFLLWFWVALGRLFGWFRGRNVMISLAVILAVSVAGTALALVPWDYRVEGLGKTMPVEQREVFAPWDGDVVEILVESGQRVKAGDPLVRIESDDLREAHVKATTELSGKRELLRTLDKQIETSRTGEDAARYETEWTRTNAELPGLEEHVRVLEGRLAALTVRAPIDGVVATFQIRQKLQDRPVRRGEVLLEVMDDTGDWRLELEVPEYRMGHVLKALAASERGTLPVEYVLATAVETSYQAEVSEIGTRTNETAEHGPVVEVFADIDPDTLPSRRIGAEVEAKINCGPRSLGYVLFGDVIEFFQRHFWL